MTSQSIGLGLLAETVTEDPIKGKSTAGSVVGSAESLDPKLPTPIPSELHILSRRAGELLYKAYIEVTIHNFGSVGQAGNGGPY